MAPPPPPWCATGPTSCTATCGRGSTRSSRSRASRSRTSSWSCTGEGRRAPDARLLHRHRMDASRERARPHRPHRRRRHTRLPAAACGATGRSRPVLARRGNGAQRAARRRHRRADVGGLADADDGVAACGRPLLPRLAARARQAARKRVRHRSARRTGGERGAADLPARADPIVRTVARRLDAHVLVGVPRALDREPFAQLVGAHRGQRDGPRCAGTAVAVHGFDGSAALGGNTLRDPLGRRRRGAALRAAHSPRRRRLARPDAARHLGRVRRHLRRRRRGRAHARHGAALAPRARASSADRARRVSPCLAVRRRRDRPQAQALAWLSHAAHDAVGGRRVLLPTYFGLPTRPLAFGLVGLVLTATVSTYLGLMITRSIGWAVTTIALGSILLMLATALYATDTGTTAVKVVALEAALATLAVALRWFAKRRWLGLDWMLSRPEAATRTAA